MTALEILSNEHGLIRRFLENLTVACEKLENGQRPPREVFDKAIQFARTFVEKSHHFKEEHVMFVRLAQIKRGDIDARLEVLKHQHERGRSFMGEISDSLEGYAREDAYRTTVLLESAAAYASLLRHHIHMEDHVFFPMAEEVLPAEELSRLSEQFAKEEGKSGAKTFEESHKLITDMGSLLAHM